MSSGTIAQRNISAFLWFRVLFNSRFYYPIFTILFLDFGLSIEQFAMLNAAWAGSIVLFEVPSGALADKLGRRQLVVASAWLMIAEMLILCLTPAHNAVLTFPLLLLNRVISGLAEACCSGADEALVYDCLEEENRGDAWTRVLASLMRWQSLTFMLVALAGAALYSPDFMHRLGFTSLTQAQCMRLPLWMNLAMAVATLVVALRFTDTHPPGAAGAGISRLVRLSYQQMLHTGSWILRQPAALVLILTGLLYDGFLRLFYTVGSNYYRLLGIDEACNGLILAGSSLLGLGTAAVVEKLVGTLKPARNFALVGSLIFAGLCGIALQVKALNGWMGVLFVVPFWLAMRSLHYFLSQYLHRVSDSEHRATVMSFKGLSMNLSYGAAMWLYARQTAWLREENAAGLNGLSKEKTDVALLGMAMPWWPWAFAVMCGLLFLFVRLRYRRNLTQLLENTPP